MLLLPNTSIVFSYFRRKAAAAALARDSLYQIPPPQPPSYKETMSTKASNTHSNHNYERRMIVNDVSSGGNSYNHIWQRPLPEEPVNPNTSPYTQRPGAVQYGYNTIESVKKTDAPQGSVGSVPGAHGDLPPPPPPQEYGNHTLARRECEPDDPRYFQIEPDTLSQE